MRFMFLVIYTFNLNSVLDIKITVLILRIVHSIFFQNEDIFVQLDELDKLDRITHAS